MHSNAPIGVREADRHPKSGASDWVWLALPRFPTRDALAALDRPRCLAEPRLLLTYLHRPYSSFSVLLSFSQLVGRIVKPRRGRSRAAHDPTRPPTRQGAKQDRAERAAPNWKQFWHPRTRSHAMPLVVPALRLFLLFLNVYETFKTLKPPARSRRTGEQTPRAVSQRKRDMKGCMTIWLLWVGAGSSFFSKL